MAIGFWSRFIVYGERWIRNAAVLAVLAVAVGCAGRQHVVVMETTGYCNCSQCCGWERGTFDFWNKYVATGKSKGKPYTGLTSSGTYPHIPHPGFFSWDTVKKPWMIPIRIVFFPWLFLARDGTLAADTAYYPFGTRMYVPGYGWGVVEDRGSAIKGPSRIDLYHFTHGGAKAWGRRKVEVVVEDNK
jgi:hypothetical protein